MSAAATPPVSKATAWKIIGTVLACVGAVAGVFYASMRQDMQLYKMVDEVTTAPEAFRGKKLQVHGYVVDKSIEMKPGTLEYRFALETRAPRKHAVIQARYTGLVPDTFKSGAEVVATGVLTADNQLAVGPDGISAKCPSKYEEKGAPGTLYEQKAAGSGSLNAAATGAPKPSAQAQ